MWAISVWSPLEKYEKQSNIKVLQIQLETFLTNRRSNLCQINTYISPVMCSLLSLDSLNRFSRSSQHRYSVKKLFLKTLQISQENTCVGVSCNKVTLIKKRLQHRYFPVRYAKFSRTPLFKSIC